MQSIAYFALLRKKEVIYYCFDVCFKILIYLCTAITKNTNTQNAHFSLSL